MLILSRYEHDMGNNILKYVHILIYLKLTNKFF